MLTAAATAAVVTLNEFLPSFIAIATTIITTIIQRYFVNVHSTFQLELLFHCTFL